MSICCQLELSFYATALVDQSHFILCGSKSKLPPLFPCFAILRFSDIAYYGFVFTDSDVIVINWAQGFVKIALYKSQSFHS